jgi:uncharacterized membrane protein YccC
VSAGWLAPTIGFASGVGVSAIATWISSLLQNRNDRRRRREQAAFQVYMLLLDLNSRYFWVASKEMHGEPAPPQIAAEAYDLAWRIADKLREADDVEHLEEILTVLMSEDAYKTASDRAKALRVLIDKMGYAVNPRYAKLIESISTNNVLGLMARPPHHRNNAPGLMSQIPRPVPRNEPHT